MTRQRPRHLSALTDEHMQAAELIRAQIEERLAELAQDEPEPED